jgi:phosphohistidine phosphatase SixA
MFEMPELCSPGSESAVDTMLNKLIGKENIAVVGHQPYLTELVKYFTAMPAEETINLDKGGMIKVSFKGFPGKGAGKMRWSMSQEDLIKV